MLDALSLNLLLATAAVAFTHTVLGPDHTLPFVMLARARGWGYARTLVVTGLCGVGHVASSILLGGVGLALGLGVARIGDVEELRGGWAAWALVAFGLAYGAWGVRRAIRSRRGLKPHEHAGHVHLHSHGDHGHDHGNGHENGSRTTFWALFIVFVLGPCEPLIPFFVLPASRGRWDLALATGLVFSVVTIVTMLAVVAVGLAGVRRVPLARMERWSHAVAGAVIAASGLAVIFLGL